MILLAENCLMFQLANGESVPVTIETVSVELIGGVAADLDPNVIRNATAAVFHYFKNELGCRSVSVEAFAGALEKVLRGFGLQLHATAQSEVVTGEEALKVENLTKIAEATCGELLFYPELRRVLRQQLRESPRMVRFHGLRGCVKQLAGVRRWSPRCDALRDQIVEYLRQCLTAESDPADCVLLVK